MMWCPITSPRERGAKDLESSTCSPSWRRQCCPADRRCTDRGLQPQAWGVCARVCMCALMYVSVACVCVYGGGRVQKGLRPKGTKRRGTEQRFLLGELKFTQATFVCQRQPETSSRGDLTCGMAQGVMLDSFFNKIWHIYMQALR